LREAFLVRKQWYSNNISTLVYKNQTQYPTTQTNPPSSQKPVAGSCSFENFIPTFTSRHINAYVLFWPVTTSCTLPDCFFWQLLSKFVHRNHRWSESDSSSL